MELSSPARRNCHDHRLRDLTVLERDPRLLSRVPRSTAASWIRRGRRPVVSDDVFSSDLQGPSRPPAPPRAPQSRPPRPRPTLQRQHALAVTVVPHAKKGASRARAGQALRGSSEFHAWGDSNLYLRRAGDSLTLSIEHRAAPSASGISLALLDDGRSLAIHIAQTRPAEPTPATAAERIEKALESSSSPPVGLAALRDACRMRTQSVSSALGLLVQQGRVAKTADGYVLARR